MTTKQAQDLKTQLSINNSIAQAIADIRTARVEQLVDSYKTGFLTAAEFLELTDNLLAAEYKQSLGRG